MKGPRARELLLETASRAASERRGNAARSSGASEAEAIARIGDLRWVEAGSGRSDLIRTPRPQAPVSSAGIIGKEKLPGPHVVLIAENVYIDEKTGADEPARRIVKGVDRGLRQLHRSAVGGQSVAFNRPNFRERWPEEPLARRRTAKPFTETPQIDPGDRIFPFLDLAEAFRCSPGSRAAARSEDFCGRGRRTIKHKKNRRSGSEQAVRLHLSNLASATRKAIQHAA